jgi:hypothetical protein
MTSIDFYEDLSDSSNGTISLDGGVLIHNNNGTWHVCQKKMSSVTHACENGRPPNPNGSTLYSDDYKETQFKKSCEVMEPEGALEKRRICSFCERILEDEFDLKRIIVATTFDESHDLEHFRAKRESSRNN